MKNQVTFCTLKRISVIMLFALFSFAYLSLGDISGSFVYADDYDFDVDYYGGWKINESWTQQEIDEHLILNYDNNRDAAEVIIRNIGTEELVFSAESLEIDESVSDVDAFVIERIKGIHRIDSGEKLTLARIAPKAGQDVGKYSIEYNICDESNNINTSCSMDFTVIGSEPKLHATPEKVEMKLKPWDEDAWEESIVIRNVYEGTFNQITAETDNSNFKAELSDAEELSSGEGRSLYVNYIGDIGSLPKAGDSGTLTINARDSENNKETSIAVPLSIVREAEEEEAPYFTMDNEDLTRAISTDSLEYYPETFYIYFTAADYDKVAFTLTGDNADSFSMNRQYGEVMIESAQNLERGTYKCTLNMYYDPDAEGGNVETSGEPFDKREIELEVYNSGDYELIFVDRNGEPIGEENLSGSSVDLGILVEGYTDLEANNLSKSIYVKNAGNKPVLISKDYLENTEENAYALNQFSITLPNEETVLLQPDDIYEYSIAPAAGMNVGRHSAEFSVSTRDRTCSAYLRAAYTVSKEGFSVEIGDDTNDYDESGNINLDLGVDKTNEWASHSSDDVVWVRNVGSEDAEISISDIVSDERLSWAFAEYSDFEESYIQKNHKTWVLVPGEEIAVWIKADYTDPVEGEHAASYKVTAKSADDEENTSEKIINVSYEISDKTYKVSLDLGGKTDTYLEESETYVIVPKKTRLEDAALEFLRKPSLRDRWSRLTGRDENGNYYTCIGWSTKPDGSFDSWENYENQHEQDKKELITEDTKIYAIWAQTIDSVNLTFNQPECGDTVSSAKVTISGENSHCAIESTSWEKVSDDDRVEVEDIFVGDTKGPNRCTIRIRSDFGYVFDNYLSVILNDESITVDEDISTSKTAVCSDYFWIYHDKEYVTRKFATCDNPGNIRHYKCKGCGQLFDINDEPISEDDIITPAKGHEYGGWVSVDENEHQRVCENDPVHIEVEEHRWDDGEVTTAATQDSTGVKTFTCEVCEKNKVEEIPKLDHAHQLEHIDRKEASCTDDGYEAHWKCSICDSVFEDASGTKEINPGKLKIEAPGHDYRDVQGSEKEAGCTEPGKSADKKCERCNDIKNGEVIPAKGHTETDIPEVPATCTENGKSAGKKCTVCEAITVAQTVIPALGHDTGKVEKKESTCTEDGLKEHWKCSRCDSIFDDEEGTVETVIDSLKINAKGHSLENVAKVNPTCKKYGTEEHWKCTSCNKLFSDDEGESEASLNSLRIDRVDHNWGNGIITKAPTCTEKGEKTYTCSMCNETKTAEVATSRHEEDEEKLVEDIKPTCEEDGKKVWETRCKNCNRLMTTRSSKIEATGHNYGDWIRVDDNHHKKVCANNEKHILTEEHSWNDGEVTKEPTCKVEGVKTYTCTICEGTKTESIEKLNHTEELIPSVPATCTSKGFTEGKKCSVCEELIEAPKEVAALGHKWDGGKVTKAATASLDGVRTYTCSACKETRTEVIPKLIQPSTPTPDVTPAPGSNPNQKGADGTPTGAGASAASADKAITAAASDEGPKGSKYAPLLLKSTKQGNSNINLAWSKAKGAKTYVVYGNACGKKNRMKKLATVKTNKYNVRKISNKLKKGTYYKFMVVALDKSNIVVSTSKVIHVATKGGKVGNHKSMNIKAKVDKNGKGLKTYKILTATSLKKGKSIRIKSTAVPASKKLAVKKHRVICYESSNTKIATVNAKGKITAKKKGTCHIYAYAQNGVSKKIKLTVK